MDDELKKVLLQNLEIENNLLSDWFKNLLESNKECRSKSSELSRLLDKLCKLNLKIEYILASLLFVINPTDDIFLYPGNCQDLDEMKRIQQHFNKLKWIFSLKINIQNKRQAELFLKMIIALTGDLQLLSSILAIRLQFMENTKTFPEEQQKIFADQTLSVYAPLANRLGISWIKSELEDLSLRYVETELYYELKQRIKKKRSERSMLVENLKAEIEKMMEDAKIPCVVKGRYKRFYSIFKKLERFNYEEIMDLIAFRILTPTVRDCYSALSYIHQRWIPRQDRIKDYISKPKPNGYQSLHTTVHISDSEVIEIQIRTHHMNKVAEFGVAAHWAYKENKKLDQNEHNLFSDLIKTAYYGEKEENNYYPSIDMLKNKIYVFTPNNDIIELPKDATSVDFAYAVHSDVGNRTTAAKKNGVITKLETPLKTGDKVEIVTSPKQTPHKEWLSFVKTSKAKSKIRHAINLKERIFNRELGWEILNKEFKKQGINLNKSIKEGKLERLSQHWRNQNAEHILTDVGYGKIKYQEIVKWFLKDISSNAFIDSSISIKSDKKSSIHSTDPTHCIRFEGIDRIPTRIAKCCDPKKGDPIIGYISMGRGISVHHENCKCFKKMDPRRQLKAYWIEKAN